MNHFVEFLPPDKLDQRHHESSCSEFSRTVSHRVWIRVDSLQTRDSYDVASFSRHHIFQEAFCHLEGENEQVSLDSISKDAWQQGKRSKFSPSQTDDCVNIKVNN